MSDDEYYYAVPESREGRIGQKIYHAALSDRRGYRNDQIGIDPEDEVWLEIFEHIGREAIEAVEGKCHD